MRLVFESVGSVEMWIDAIQLTEGLTRTTGQRRKNLALSSVGAGRSLMLLCIWTWGVYYQCAGS